LLWQTSVPDDLVLPDVDPTQGLSRQVVDEAEDFETFTRWNFVLSQVAFIGVLALYAWRGARFTRESAAGRIGTGMLLGMLGLALAGSPSCRSSSRTSGGSVVTSFGRPATSTGSSSPGPEPGFSSSASGS
jgi:hypothetical protein